MKIPKISRKTLNQAENTLIVSIFIMLFYWAKVSVSVWNVSFAALIALAWFIVHEVLKQTKFSEMVDLEKEISVVLSSFGTKKAKLNSRAAYSGNVIYPRKFMSQKLNDHFDRK